MKKLCMLIAMMLIGMSAIASQKAMKITFVGGSSVSYEVSALPEISFADEMLVVSTATTKENFAKADVAEITFVTTSAVESLNDGKADALRVAVEASRIVVKTPADGIVSVYDLNGRLLNQAPAVGGVAELEITTTGVLIVNACGKSVKIVK